MRATGLPNHKAERPVTPIQTAISSIFLLMSAGSLIFGVVSATRYINQSNAAQVSAADLENLKLTEQANLAVLYFQLRGQDALEELYQKTVEVDQQSLELTRVLYKSGIDNDEAVAQAEIALNSAEAAATNAGIARAQYEHAIALLVGEPASTFSIPVKALTTQVPDIPVGVPSELLERRPISRPRSERWPKQMR